MDQGFGAKSNGDDRQCASFDEIEQAVTLLREELRPERSKDAAGEGRDLSGLSQGIAASPAVSQAFSCSPGWEAAAASAFQGPSPNQGHARPADDVGQRKLIPLFDGVMRAPPAEEAGIESYVGFKTAVGAGIEISEEARRRADAVFCDKARPQDEAGPESYVGFKTAAGAGIEISEEARRRADAVFCDKAPPHAEDRLEAVAASGTMVEESAQPTGTGVWNCRVAVSPIGGSAHRGNSHSAPAIYATPAAASNAVLCLAGRSLTSGGAATPQCPASKLPQGKSKFPRGHGSHPFTAPRRTLTAGTPSEVLTPGAPSARECATWGELLSTGPRKIPTPSLLFRPDLHKVSTGLSRRASAPSSVTAKADAPSELHPGSPLGFALRMQGGCLPLGKAVGSAHPFSDITNGDIAPEDYKEICNVTATNAADFRVRIHRTQFFGGVLDDRFNPIIDSEGTQWRVSSCART